MSEYIEVAFNLDKKEEVVTKITGKVLEIQVNGRHTITVNLNSSGTVIGRSFVNKTRIRIGLKHVTKFTIGIY